MARTLFLLIDLREKNKNLHLRVLKGCLIFREHISFLNDKGEGGNVVEDVAKWLITKLSLQRAL